MSEFEQICSAEGGEVYAERKAVVEQVFGVLKTTRGIKQFRIRKIEKRQQRIHPAPHMPAT